MELTARQKLILKAIVECYVETAEPVGSKTIAAMPGMDFSSATIRNEMAELTSLGLLEQPHTSAGRVPSPDGYRLYVDELMQQYRLSEDETHSLNEALDLKMKKVDRMLTDVGKLVSRMTDLPAYAVASRSRTVTVRRFELLMAETHCFILVVMLSTESVKNKLIKLPLELTEQDLKLLSAVLNASLTDLELTALTPELLAKVERSAGAAASLVPVVMDFVTAVLTEEQHSEVYLTGQTRLLGQPEYHDVAKAQQVLSTLDEDIISNLPAPTGDKPLQILVGPEEVAKELKDTSVVMTRFDIGDGMEGLIGVVGPTRMDYARVTARLSYFAESLGRMFGKSETIPAGPEPPRQLKPPSGETPHKDN